MKEDLVILTCGGTGRELAELLGEEYNVIGFLDDYKTGPSVIGTLNDVHKYLTTAKICSGLGSYRSMMFRRKVLGGIPPDAFITYLAGDARVYPSAAIGKGVTVFPKSVISAGTVLSNHSFVYHGSVVAHDASIGEYSMISNSVCISGAVTIGKNCYIGAGSVILEKISIGDNCVIAAGAVVISDVPDNKIYISDKKIKDNHYQAL